MSENNSIKRILFDRRERPTPLVSRYTFVGGRRQTIRRKRDKKKHLFVDLYSLRLFVIIVALLLLSCVDAYLTLELIKSNAVIEINPFMAISIKNGILSFIFVKFFITALALTIVCLYKNIYIARIGLPFAIVMYIAVVLYELFIMYKVYPQ